MYREGSMLFFTASNLKTSTPPSRLLVQLYKLVIELHTPTRYFTLSDSSRHRPWPPTSWDFSSRSVISWTRGNVTILCWVEEVRVILLDVWLALQPCPNGPNRDPSLLSTRLLPTFHTALLFWPRLSFVLKRSVTLNFFRTPVVT